MWLDNLILFRWYLNPLWPPFSEIPYSRYPGALSWPAGRNPTRAPSPVYMYSVRPTSASELPWSCPWSGPGPRCCPSACSGPPSTRHLRYLFEFRLNYWTSRCSLDCINFGSELAVAWFDEAPVIIRPVATGWHGVARVANLGNWKTSNNFANFKSKCGFWHHWTRVQAMALVSISW